MRRAVLAALASLAVLVSLEGAAAAETPRQVGVLVLAHGGSEEWNRQVRESVAQAELGVPTEIAFGMGMHAQEAAGMQDAIERLIRQGSARLIVVPLLVSSASDVMRQFEYLLGLRQDGPWEEIEPLALSLPVAMTGALDADPLVGDILLERARALSHAPAQESVALIAHGPTSDEDNAHWLRVMDALAEQLKRAAGFRAVVPVTMRDDAPEPIVEEATRAMREQITRMGQESRVLVVPLLLATGGIEHKIPQRLAGLVYAYSGEALLPHPALSRWIAKQVRQSAVGAAVAATQPLVGQREAARESSVAGRQAL